MNRVHVSINRTLDKPSAPCPGAINVREVGDKGLQSCLLLYSVDRHWFTASSYHIKHFLAFTLSVKIFCKQCVSIVLKWILKHFAFIVCCYITLTVHILYKMQAVARLGGCGQAGCG